VFVYLSQGVLPRLPFDIVHTLLPFASRLVISAPGHARANNRICSCATAHGCSRVTLPLSETLASSRLVIHFGGGGLAAHTIATGVPQLIFATHIEQLLNGLQSRPRALGKSSTVSHPD
jgi:UDP:flavonoid glycosyltransferase YjiC (YdhE family)